jgi:SAM-dependent MidA family methyltransferase
VGVEALVRARIGREGSISFEELVDRALYDEEGGFYGAGAGAGRRGHFLTSPEVGPLFGAVVARALDAWWDELGRPDPFVVVESAAGRGVLAAAVLAAAPACAPALRYVCVERSPALRVRQAERLPLAPAAEVVPGARAAGDPGRGPLVASLAALPAPAVTGVVLANELLDNLPFALLERTADGWAEVRVAEDADRLVEHRVPAPASWAHHATRLAPDAPVGGRIPLQRAAGAWLRAALGTLERGRVVVVDYADATPSMAARPWQEWLRTYRAHQRGDGPLDHLGDQDVTCEVATDQLALVAPPSADRDQAGWLADHGIEELVAAARATWHERAHLGDLIALRARSRIGEAEALTDPTGLGAFRVLEWVR